ncbi:hypothetical protein CONPUDRAFT_145552 [Coniophora puteana RWD-64-598 SS2]|uniref:F-box domain-containing protein n=1 Tax=Coniophora puteana (strain RWD-64-598) TaxID=741705 RepID=A0A5M3MHI6_CONPW|nr:uncharacterized protein CONPUDRAFT_145552 [Coniophora puteana RWD-64-598 SS2]EIW78244.1 hypothetical protein CONPUDRAFT_145552 [Coniophora puteana RWD-64-598 SS2]
MHRCLCIAEILSFICHQIRLDHGNATLAALAQTCTSLSDTALDELEFYANINSDDFLCCLHGDLVKFDPERSPTRRSVSFIDLLRPIRWSDLEVVRRHGKRVLCLTYDHTLTNHRIYLTQELLHVLANTSYRLFPSLRVLSWRFGPPLDEETLFVGNLLVPTLKDVSLSQFFELVPAIVPRLFQIAPSIQSLTLNPYDSAVFYDTFSSLGQCLMGRKSLKELYFDSDLRDIYSQLLSVVPSLPSLETLHLTSSECIERDEIFEPIEQEPSVFYPEAITPFFPALQTLFLGGPYLHILQTPNRFRSVTSVDVITGRPEYEPFIHGLTMSLPHDILTSLTIRNSIDWDPATDYACSSTVFRPLAVFKNLTHFVHASKWPIAWSDAGIDELSGFWPKLCSFSVDANPARTHFLCEGRLMNIRRLGILLTNCPLLEVVCVYLFAIELEEDKVEQIDQLPRHERLDQLNLFCSPIQPEADEVAKLLKHMLPRLKSLSHNDRKLATHPSRPLVMEQWREVAKRVTGK